MDIDLCALFAKRTQLSAHHIVQLPVVTKVPGNQNTFKKQQLIIEADESAAKALQCTNCACILAFILPFEVQRLQAC